MSNIYEDQYGVTFGGHHSFKDYHLYPTSKPVIAPPVVRNYLLEVPGRSGSIDMTEVLTGGVIYGDREGTFTYKLIEDRSQWNSIVARLISDIHGKRMDVKLDDEPGYYYNGRITVSGVSYEENFATIQIKGVFSPFRDESEEFTGNNWMWNPFDFVYGKTFEYYQIPVNGEEPLVLLSKGEDALSPVFILESGHMEIEYNGNTYQLETGRNMFYQIVVSASDVDVIARGYGVLTITYMTGG